MTIEILTFVNKYARTEYTCRISSDARQHFRDQELVNIVDAGGDIKQAFARNNFGGRVEPMPGGLYRVTVYVD